MDIADVVPKMTERIMTTKRSISSKFCVIEEDQEFAPTVIPTSTLDLCFDDCSYEEQVRICSRTFYIDYVALLDNLWNVNILPTRVLNHKHFVLINDCCICFCPNRNVIVPSVIFLLIIKLRNSKKSNLVLMISSK